MKLFKYIILALILVSTIGPVTAQSSGLFAQITVTDEGSQDEAVRINKKKELTAGALKKAVEKAELMQEDLEKIGLEKEMILPQMLKEEFLADVSGYIAVYEEAGKRLVAAQTLEEVDLIITEVITYRETAYVPTAKRVLEFILVYSYSPSVLDIANERLQNIAEDVQKLEDLSLIEPGQFTEALNTASTTIMNISNLQSNAKELLISGYATSTTLEGKIVLVEVVPIIKLVSTPRGLAEESLNLIKGLYDLFLETGTRVEKALGISHEQQAGPDEDMQAAS